MKTALHIWTQLPEQDQPLETYLTQGLQRLLDVTHGDCALITFPRETEGQVPLEVGQTAQGGTCSPGSIPQWEAYTSGEAQPPQNVLLYPLPGIPGGWLYLGADHPLDDNNRALGAVFASLAALIYENRTLQNDLQAAREDKARFVSVVSHELRLPMTSIKGYTDLLLKGMTGALNDMQTNFLTVIRNNVERMSRLISDISDLSKAESGRLTMQSTAFPLLMQVQKAVEAFQEACEGKKQHLEVDIPGDLPPVQGDPQRVTQITEILLRNAHLYTPEGGSITLRGRLQGEDIRLEVTDSGIGITTDDAARIFEQFFRSEDQRVRDHPGWGLGLSVAQALVHLMDGEIGFESAPETGSTFWITLPVAAQ